MEHPMAGIVLGGIIPAFVFGGYGLMQKQCMRAGLGIEAFFLVLGLTRGDSAPRDPERAGPGALSRREQPRRRERQSRGYSRAMDEA
jgi:hypothetical protein